VLIFSDKDNQEPDENGAQVDETRGRFNLFMSIQSLMTIGMCLPAIFLIKDKPPSPPSMVATKPRPVQTFREAFNGLISNANYVHIFMYF